MKRILGNAQLKTHYGREGILFCMASKSGNYLNPHLTMNLNEVTCNKCLRLLKPRCKVDSK